VAQQEPGVDPNATNPAGAMEEAGLAEIRRSLKRGIFRAAPRSVIEHEILTADGLCMDERNLRQIACLACSATRVVFGTTLAETGECPRCRYVGWTYSDDLDGTTKRMIMNGLLANGTTRMPHSVARDSHISAR
jgi:hypothetical protein